MKNKIIIKTLCKTAPSTTPDFFSRCRILKRYSTCHDICVGDIFFCIAPLILSHVESVADPKFLHRVVPNQQNKTTGLNLTEIKTFRILIIKASIIYNNNICTHGIQSTEKIANLLIQTNPREKIISQSLSTTVSQQVQTTIHNTQACLILVGAGAWKQEGSGCTGYSYGKYTNEFHLIFQQPTSCEAYIVVHL